MWTTNYILSQVFAICAYLVFPLSFLTRNKKIILALNMLNSLFYLLSYLFLAGYTGVIVNAVGIARGICFFVVGEIYHKREYISLILFTATTLILSIVFYSSWVDILAMLGGILFTYAIWQKNIEFYRWASVVSSILWITYNVVIFSIFGIVGETCCFIAETVILVVYYVKRHKEKKQENQLPTNVENNGNI